MKNTDVEILIVEDSPEIAELTQRALKKIKAVDNFVWLNNGDLASDFIFRQGAYADRPETQLRLILLDLHLPTLNGHGLLERIKSNPATASIPVVMLTSSTDIKDIADSYRLGANSYVVKPMDPIEFIKTVFDAGFYWTMRNKTA